MKLLQRVHEAMQGPAASSTCLEQFRSTGKMSRESAEEFASGTFANLQELLVSEHGIKTSSVTDAEITRFVKDANTKDAGSFGAVEYQELMTKLVKYAALKSRRSPRKRLTLGVSLSAAAAVAVSAVLPVAAATSAGVMVAAAPVGAAVGAIAVTIDSRRQPARDRKRATRHTPRKPAVETSPAAEITAAEVPAAEVGTAEAAPITPQPAAAAAAPTGEAAADSTTPIGSTGGSEELVSAVIEVMPPADAAAAASPFSKESLAAAGLPVTATAALEAAAPAPSGDSDMAGLPELVQSASPEKHAAEAADCISPQLSSARVSMDVPMFDDHVGSTGAQLPPLATKKKSTGTKAIKKSLSKSYKNVKKAFSLNSSGSLDAAADAAVERADGSIIAPTGKPPKSSFLRRSFSRDSSSLSDKDAGGLLVQPSEGSATLRKMKEAFRRSFDLKRSSSSSNRISMDSALGTA